MLEMSILSKVMKNLEVDSNDCWLWQKALTSHGYATMRVGTKMVKVHRAMLIEATGLVGKFACHKCHVRRCVNPDHLYWGDAATNNADTREQGKSFGGFQFCPKQKLTEKDYADIKEARKTRKHGTGRQLAKQYGVHEVTIYRVWTPRPV